VQEVSPEKLNVAEAECVPAHEGFMCAVDMRDGDAPPGSWSASCTNGVCRNLGEPIGSGDDVVVGGAARGVTGVLRRAEIGSRTGS
jgi:hypothetical protein